MSDDVPLKPAVHPHTCGEISANNQIIGGNGGSPPHVWGNLWLNGGNASGERFTPTRVGKSEWHHDNPRDWAVHPHTCGEILPAARHTASRCGSPPHVWGNPPNTDIAPNTDTVHPHTCGEIFRDGLPDLCYDGSPPHVWGNPAWGKGRPTGVRFTPTRVGKSASENENELPGSVHPHTCGEIHPPPSPTH